MMSCNNDDEEDGYDDDDHDERFPGMSPVFKQTHSFLYLPSYFAVVIFLVEV